MSRPRTLALLLVVALAAVAWFVTSSPPAVVRDARGPGPATSPDVGPAPVAVPTPTGLARSTPPRTPRRTDGPRIVDGVVRERGGVRLEVVREDGGDVPADLRLDLEPRAFRLERYPLAVREEDGTWTYDALPVGPYRVRGVAEGWQATSVEVKVRADEDVAARLVLAPGGTIRYEVKLASGEAPEAVRMSLLDGRGQPAPTTVRVPGGALLHGADPKTLEAALPGQATLVGLKPGRYTLRLTAPSGEFDETTVDVRAGETATVALRISR